MGWGGGGVVSSCGTDSALELINCEVNEPVQNIFAVSKPTEQILLAPLDRVFIDKGRACVVLTQLLHHHQHAPRLSQGAEAFTLNNSLAW